MVYNVNESEKWRQKYRQPSVVVTIRGMWAVCTDVGERGIEAGLVETIHECAQKLM